MTTQRALGFLSRTFKSGRRGRADAADKPQTKDKPAQIDLCLLAGMIDAKLRSKLAPIQAAERVRSIHLVRRYPFVGDKIVCHVPPRIVARWLPVSELWRLMTLAYLALRKRPSCLVALGTVPHGIYCWWVGAILGIPAIQHVKGNDDLRIAFPNQRGRSLALAAVRAAAAVTVRGRRMAAWLQSQELPEGRIFVQQNLHDFSIFAPSERQDIDYDLVYVGTFHRVKRLDLLMQTLAQVRRQRPQTNLLMVGDGPERAALESLVCDLGLQEAVSFVGRQDFGDLPRFYGDARVFVMTSQSEGLPMSMIEAMSMGLPVIVPAVGDIEEIAKHQQNALIFPAFDTEACANAIVTLLEDRDLYQRLRAGALRLREERATEYSLDYQSAIWTDILDKVANHG